MGRIPATSLAFYRYDPWGTITEQGGSDSQLASRNALRYRGYYHDEATGLYYLPARYYDPATARFLSADPASPSAGDPLTLNRYTYCVDDPVNASDPSGAVTDVEAEAWKYYYNTHSGNRVAAGTHTHSLRSWTSKARADSSAGASAPEDTRYAVTVAGGEQLTAGPGSVIVDDYIYNPFDLRPTPPSSADNAVLLIGFGCDIGTCTPLSSFSAVVGIVVDAGWTGAKTVQAAKAHATLGDVFLSAVSAVPFVSTVESFWFYPQAEEEGWYADRHERLR